MTRNLSDASSKNALIQGVPLVRHTISRDDGIYQSEARCTAAVKEASKEVSDALRVHDEKLDRYFDETKVDRGNEEAQLTSLSTRIDKLEELITEIGNKQDGVKVLLDQKLVNPHTAKKGGHGKTKSELTSVAAKVDALEKMVREIANSQASMRALLDEKLGDSQAQRVDNNISESDASLQAASSYPFSVHGMEVVLYDAGTLVAPPNTASTGVGSINWDLWTHPQHANGSFVELSQRNGPQTFAVLEAKQSKIQLFSRQGKSWHIAGETDASEAARVPLHCNAPATLTKIAGTKDLEGICWDSTGSLQDWRISDDGKTWSLICRFAEGNINGYPTFISSEGLSSPRWPLSDIVVRHTDSCLHHWQRNERTKQPWKDNGKIELATGNIMMSGPSLVRVGADLYVTAVLLSGKLQMFWYDCKDGVWKEGEVFGSGFQSTTPCMIQSRYFEYSSPGNFEVCIAKHGKVEHWYRDNSQLRTNPPSVNQNGSPWRRTATFGHDVLKVIGLVQSCFLGSDGKSHNLELVVERTDHKLQHYWRNGVSGWNQRCIF